jgi:hypothetical protein
LCSWLREGPPAAHVTAVEIEHVATATLPGRPAGFSTA